MSIDPLCTSRYASHGQRPCPLSPGPIHSLFGRITSVHGAGGADSEPSRETMLRAAANPCICTVPLPSYYCNRCCASETHPLIFCCFLSPFSRLRRVGRSTHGSTHFCLALSFGGSSKDGDTLSLFCGSICSAGAASKAQDCGEQSEGPGSPDQIDVAVGCWPLLLRWKHGCGKGQGAVWLGTNILVVNTKYTVSHTFLPNN